MPMGSRMPSCASTKNSCGSTCRTSRSGGSVMLRAASIARRTSSRSISRGRWPMVTPPRLFTPRTCAPATPITAASTGTLATPSASSTARRIELTVESRLTIRPLRSPFDSAAPKARNFTCSSSISAISAHVFMLPMSNPIRYLSFFATLAPDPLLSRFRNGGAGRVRVEHHLLRVLQIDGVDTAVVGLPLRKIFDDHAVLPGEVARAEMNGQRLRVAGAGDAGHDRAQILWVGEVHFTDAIGRAGAHQVDVVHELLIRLHALAALFAGHALGESGDDGKLQLFAARTIENHAVRVDERQLGSIADKSDGRALGQLNANAIGENALQAGGLDPGNLFESSAAGVQRNAENAEAAIARKLLQHRFAADDVIAANFDLIRPNEQHGLAIQQKAAGRPCGGDARDSNHAIKKYAPVEWPAPSGEFLAADFNGLLTPQIARLIVTEQLGPIRLGVRRGATRQAFHASQMTTSCSSSTSNAERTRWRTSAINVSMSFALALPAFTKKLAWRSLTRASPQLRPFRPSSSIMRPADAPGGFLKMQPALFWPSGWLERRFSLQIRIPFRISLYGLEGSSNITASIISSGAKEVCRYSKEI